MVNSVIRKFGLTDRVVSITTDNAASNGIMISEINTCFDKVFSNGRFLSGLIQHIPCLAHIIQLALKALLGKIRLWLTNDTFINE